MSESLEPVDVAGLRVPWSYVDLVLVEPGWDTEVRYADGIYLGATEQDGVLEFTAVDIHGEVLWAAQRPASCTGFALTTDAQGRTLAVLTDTQTTEEALAGTTASAYVLATGEQVWGPVDVPGPHQGPGLVFAAPPQEYIGASGPRDVLDATSGELIATESDAEVAHIVGEYHGTVLLVQDDELIARAAGDSSELWSLSLAEHGWTATITAAVGGQPAAGLALIRTDTTSALVDLEQGVVMHDELVDAAVDPLTGTMVLLSETAVRAYTADGTVIWELAAPAGGSIDVLGDGFLYLRADGVLRVYNVLTGELAEAYDPQGEGPLLVPTHIPANGAALLSDGERQLLVTIPA